MRSSKSRIGYRGRTTYKMVALAVAIASCLPMHGMAAEKEKSPSAIVSFSIPGGDLSMALERFSTQSGIQVLYRQELVEGKLAREVRGPLAPTTALARLLEGSGLVIERVNDKTYVLKPKPASAPRKPPAQEPKPPRVESAESASNEPPELETVVVVGSRLGVSPYDAMSMAKVIDREEIERSGASTIAQVLSTLPEVSVNNNGDTPTVSGVGGSGLSGRSIGFSTVQLRGLPQGTTLVLINGRRAGGAAISWSSDTFDLSTIPLAMVERIEVLPMGSSAVYGGDGLAGVVNIVLRRDAQGFEFDGRHMVTNGSTESNAGLTYGKAWSKGRMMANATWRKTGMLTSKERDITADADYRRFGGPDLRQTWTYPGNVYSMEGCDPPSSYGYACFIPIDDRGNLPGLTSPFAGIPVGQNGQGLTPGDFAQTAGNLNRATSAYHLSSPTKQYGLGLSASFNWSDTGELFTEWTLTRRKVDAEQFDLSIIGGEYGFNDSLVPAANPFNPFGVDVGVDYRFENTGFFHQYEDTYWRGLVGARGEARKWIWEVTAWQSKDRSDTGDYAYFDTSEITAHLQSTDPATALNPFAGDGTAPASPEVMRELLHPNDDSFSTTVQGANGYLRRSFKVPAGNATGLIGAEYERTLMDSNPGDSIAVIPFDGNDDRQALFAEARVPLLAGDDGGWERLAMSGAARYESTGRSQGNAFTTGFELDFRPSPQWSIRANYATAFKPLNLAAASSDPRLFNSFVADPQFGGNYFPIVLHLSGGTPPGLEPETSKSLSLAAVYATSHAKLSIMHWESRLRDRLLYLGPQGVVNNEAAFPGRVTRDPVTGVITAVDARVVNVSATNNAGVDLSAEMNWTTRYGDLMPSLAASYVYKYDDQLTPTSEVENNVARWNDSGWAPRWKVVPRMGWYGSVIGATLTGRYISRYEDPEPLSTGEVQKLGNFWNFDLNMDVDLSRLLGGKAGIQEAHLSFGAANLFNRLPDYCNACAVELGRGYDPTQYDIIGRRMYAELKVSF